MAARRSAAGHTYAYKRQPGAPEEGDRATEASNDDPAETSGYDEFGGEEDEESVMVGGAQNLIVSDGAMHMKQVYRKWPQSSSIVQVDLHQRRYNVEHHRVQVNFYNHAAIAGRTDAAYPSTAPVGNGPSAAGTIVPSNGQKQAPGAIQQQPHPQQIGLMKQAIFPRQDKEWNQNVRVVAIGMNSWYCDGDVPIGIRFEGHDGISGQTRTFPAPYAMGSEMSFTYTFPNRGQCPNVNQLIFEARPPNRLNKLFPHWTESDAEVGVKQMILKDNPQKQYLLELPERLPNGEVSPDAHIPCPLAYFRMLLLSQDPLDVPLMMHNSYVIDEAKYKRYVDQFVACVSDSRIMTSMSEFYVYAHPMARGAVRCSMVLDVYYSRVN